MNNIIIHYDEIGLKGKNRNRFELLLIDNIKNKLKDHKFLYIKEYGHIILEFEKLTDDIIKKISCIPGIANYLIAKKTTLKTPDIEKIAINILKDKNFDSFKIDSKRRNKDFKTKSIELNKHVGEKILDKYKDKKVLMKKQDITIIIEILTKNAYIGTRKIEGIGGLPTDKRQKMISLISGGIDSPVASYLMMKRGCQIIFTHFQNQTQNKSHVKDKIKKIVKKLSRYQINTKLYIFPFNDIQKQIILNIKSEYRMLIYRRFMLKISSIIAKKEDAKFLVTGDSLSQVASQTIDNLNSTYNNIQTNILTPLIGLDKKDITNISKKINTFTLSSLPYQDCCSFFVPKHPKLNSRIEDIKRLENLLDIDPLIQETIKKAEIIEF